MRKRVILALLALFCTVGIVISFALPAAATVTGDITGNSNLTVWFYNKVTLHNLSGATFYLYQVGSYDSRKSNVIYTYEPTEKFKDFADIYAKLTDIDLSKAAEVADLAGELAKYTKKYSIAADASGTTNEDGKCSFDDLKPGLYLVWGSEVKSTEDGKVYTPSPFLIPLPYPAKDGFDYNVTAEPKYGSDEERTTSNPAPSESLPPSESLELFESPPPSAGLWMSESPPPSEGIPPSSPPGLPQTGQLWWPVPLLVVVGVLMLLIGAVLFVRKEESEEALEVMELLRSFEKPEEPEQNEEHEEPHE